VTGQGIVLAREFFSKFLDDRGGDGGTLLNNSVDMQWDDDRSQHNILQVISLLFNEQVVSLFSSISPSSESRAARPFSIVAGVALKVFCSNFSNLNQRKIYR
jgi:hypothetical protein